MKKTLLVTALSLAYSLNAHAGPITNTSTTYDHAGTTVTQNDNSIRNHITSTSTDNSDNSVNTATDEKMPPTRKFAACWNRPSANPPTIAPRLLPRPPSATGTKP